MNAASSEPLSPGSATDNAFVYKFLPADYSVSYVAQRFNADPRAVCTLNGQPWEWTPAPGDSILIPRPPEETFDAFWPPGSSWAQFNVTDSSITLAALLARLSSNNVLASIDGDAVPGSGRVELREALAIWHHWRNAILRERILSRTPAAAGPAAGLAQFSVGGAPLAVALPATDVVERDGPGAALLTSEDSIFLPLVPIAVHLVAVAPDAPAHVDLTPTPLERVRQTLASIESLDAVISGIRASMQQIQLECAEDLRILKKMRALVFVEQQQFAAAGKVQGDDGSRAALLAALDALLQNAPKEMLKPDAYAKIDPSLPGRWNVALKRLRTLVSDKDGKTRALLDQVIPQSGELPCILHGMKDRRNFVDTLSVVCARAAYWLAQAGTAEDQELLLDAVEGVGAAKKGSAPTAGSTKSLLDYAGRLAAAGPKLSPSCGGAASVAYCGAVTNLYAAAALLDPRGDPNACVSNVEASVKATIEMSLDAYVAGCERESKEDGGPFARAAQAYGTYTASKEPGEAKEKLEEEDSAEEIAEKDAASSARRAFQGDPALIARAREMRQQFSNPELHLGTFPSKMGVLWLFAKIGIAMGSAGWTGYKATQKEDDAERLSGLLKTGQGSVDAASEALKTMKKLGILEEAAGGELGALLGPVSLGMGALLEIFEASEAFELQKTQEGWGHVLEGLGMGIMLTGGVCVWVGIGALIAGLVVVKGAEYPDLFEGGPQVEFEKNFKRFRHYAEKLEALRIYVSPASRYADNCVLPPLDQQQFGLYRNILEGAGFTEEELT